MKTYSLKATDIRKQWFIVDAAGKTVGRISSEISRVLMGKHRPTYTPHLDCGDNIIVINAAQVKFTGMKTTDKNYDWHSGYAGGKKQASAAVVFKKHPERIIIEAVKGMLPKNKLARVMTKNLRVFPGAEHTHEAQKPQVGLQSRLKGRGE
jgi:large subunit ribosomal protein L13